MLQKLNFVIDVLRFSAFFSFHPGKMGSRTTEIAIVYKNFGELFVISAITHLDKLEIH